LQYLLNFYFINIYFIGINNEKLKQSRVITIKSKYFDPSSGGMKDAVNPSDLYSIKKK
jgi:hypothetical protein